MPIDANHKTMCKFSSEESQIYRPVWRPIQSFVRHVTITEDVSSVKCKLFYPTFRQYPLADAVSVTHDEIDFLRSFYSSDQKSAKNRIPNCVEGTCKWILQHQKYKDWFNASQSALLWVSGEPGCGKTVLASFLIDELQTRLPNTTICYFFCDDN